MLIKEVPKVFVIVFDIIFIIIIGLALVKLGAVILLCHSYSRYSS